jgi:hypothetical protein
MDARSKRAYGRMAAVALAWLAFGSTISSADEPTPAPRPTDRAALEAMLARDQARLEDLLIRRRDPDEPPLHDDPELKLIAERMPALQRALREADPRPVGAKPSGAPDEGRVERAGGWARWQSSIPIPPNTPATPLPATPAPTPTPTTP